MHSATYSEREEIFKELSKAFLVTFAPEYHYEIDLITNTKRAKKMTRSDMAQTLISEILWIQNKNTIKSSTAWKSNAALGKRK